jgi:hypothetical protein
MNEVLFEFGLLYQKVITLCAVKRIPVGDELQHAVVFNGRQYLMAIKDDSYRFVDSYMNKALRGYEDYITSKIFAKDM